MTILIFIIILLVLILIHEFGHFFAAKISNVRVDEFAFGFPPKLFSKKYGETEYILNSIPIGGYVKIYGENGEENNIDKENKETKNKKLESKEKENKNIKDRNFSNKSAFIKIFILSAGVIMNIILAYILIIYSTFLYSGITVDENDKNYKKYLSENRISESKILISDILKNSPADKSSLKIGDEIISLSINKEKLDGNIISKEEIDLKKYDGNNLAILISGNINSSDKNFNKSITIVHKNKNEISTTTLGGVYGLSENNKKIIGLSFVKIAKVDMTFFESLKLGFEKTNLYIYLTIIGFKDLFIDIFTKGEISKDIAGPVGIFNMVDIANDLGFSHLLIFTAILSISLAIFNILPFPALDGGRIIFVLFESITRKKISEKWQLILNGFGFLLLILLMIIVTVKDIFKLFN